MKKYLFDFDGTLVDSMSVFVDVLLGMLDEEKIPYGDDMVKILTPLGLAGIARYFVELGVKGTEEEIAERIMVPMRVEYKNNIPAKKNVIETLKKLKAQGADLNVLTASPHQTLDPCLRRLGLFDIFTNVWSCDDFGTTKADPEIYKMAAQRLGVSVSEVLFIDDNLNADKTAKQAGMTVFGIYDKYSEEYADEMKEVCDGYIYDFAELSEVKI